MKAYEVAIVGAGVHGASAAFHLAGRGVRVVILERGTPASGPTGRSSAVLRGYYVNEFLARATRESIEMFKNFTELTRGGQAGYVRCGALILHAADDESKLRATAKKLNEIGTRTEVLDRHQLATDFPMFDLNGVEWAAWEEEAGHADPAGTTYGLLNRAIELGAELRQHTDVVRIDRASSTLRLVTAGSETIEAERVLLCTGPWTSRMLAMVGLDIPLSAERHIIASCAWADANPVPFVWASIPDSIYFKPEVHAQYLVGTLTPEPAVDPDDFDEELSLPEQLRLTKGAVRRLPGLEESEARSGYAALYDVSPDWQPVVGEIDEKLFVVAGTAGHGFKWAPVMGRHVTDLITGEEVPGELAQFHPDRFGRQELLDAGYGAARILG